VYIDVHNEKTACFDTEDSPNGTFAELSIPNDVPAEVQPQTLHLKMDAQFKHILTRMGLDPSDLGYFSAYDPPKSTMLFSFGADTKNDHYKDHLPPLVLLYDTLRTLKIPKSLAYDVEFTNKLSNEEAGVLAPFIRGQHYVEHQYAPQLIPSYAERKEAILKWFEPLLAQMHPKVEIPSTVEELLQKIGKNP
jgi:hypothetical protein